MARHTTHYTLTRCTAGAPYLLRLDDGTVRMCCYIGQGKVRMSEGDTFVRQLHP